MTTSGLWNESFGAIGATLKSLENAGITPLNLKKIRSNPKLAAQIAKLLTSQEKRTEYTYPPEYKTLNIVDQVTALQKISAFAELDATWILNEGQDWYDSLNLPDWVENPLVYVWYESLGGYHVALDLIIKTITEERGFYNYCKNPLTPGYLRQNKATREAEIRLKTYQPGDFLIVPSQAGNRWGNYPVCEVRELYDNGEFGLGAVAVGCLILSHPNRLVDCEELDMDCPGDEIEERDSDFRFGRAPGFRFFDNKVKLGAGLVNIPDERFGSVSGYFPY